MLTIEQLRMKVRRIDFVLLELLRQRFVFTEAIGDEKRRLNLDIEDSAWEYIKMRELLSSASPPLLQDDVIEIFSVIINRSRSQQGVQDDES